MEIWKSVIGYEGRYEVSNLGRVRSLNRKTAHKNFVAYRKGKVMSQSLDKDGYLLLRLCNGRCLMKKVHRLVAMAFIPNPKNKPCINHIDNNPSNNHVNNLEWVTYKENSIYRDKQGRNGSWRRYRPVIQFTVDNKKIAEYKSIKSAVHETGIVTISDALKGRQHTAGGYIWEYK